MFLAWKEIRRAKARFGLLAAVVGLLLFLILVQQTLQAGLITSFIGGIRNQSAEVIVYSVDARRNLAGGVLPPDLEAMVEGVDGVGAVGWLGQASVSATMGSEGSADGATDANAEVTSVALLGYEAEGLGSPTTLSAGRLPQGPGEGVADEAQAADGFDIGDVIRVEPGGYDITVVGQAREIGLLVSPTVFVLYPTYVAAQRAANPDATVDAPPNALAVQPAEGTSAADLVERLNAASPAVDALTRSQAADATPGVAQIQQSFQLIFGLFAIVVPLVTGLFFLIVTFQKTASLTLLRAIGAAPGRLVAGLLVQVTVIVLAGAVVGTLLYAPLTQLRIGAIALRFQGGAALAWTVVLLVLGLLSALVSVRRILAIDPVAALTGTGGGR